MFPLQKLYVKPRDSNHQNQADNGRKNRRTFGRNILKVCHRTADGIAIRTNFCINFYFS